MLGERDTHKRKEEAVNTKMSRSKSESSGKGHGLEVIVAAQAC